MPFRQIPDKLDKKSYRYDLWAHKLIAFINITANIPQTHPSSRGCLSPPLGGEQNFQGIAELNLSGYLVLSVWL